MEYCMNTRSWRLQRIATLLIAIVLFCLLGGYAIAMILYSEDEVFSTIMAIFLILAAVWSFIYFFLVYMKEARKFCMDEEGLTVSCFPKQKRFYPWKAFFGIVVCDFNHASKNPENCQLIIRMSAFDEDDGPYSKNPSRTFWGMEKWRGYKYTEKNFDKIVFLGYSPELLEEVCRLSKLPVTYSLTQYGEALMAQNKADGNWDR